MAQPTADEVRKSLIARSNVVEQSLYERGKKSELHPRQDFDGFLRPGITMKQETHRLLRAVAIKRAAKIPGEPPSIGAIVEELVERFRAELEREAGPLLKRELAKKR